MLKFFVDFRKDKIIKLLAITYFQLETIYPTLSLELVTLLLMQINSPCSAYTSSFYVNEKCKQSTKTKRAIYNIISIRYFICIHTTNFANKRGLLVMPCLFEYQNDVLMTFTSLKLWWNKIKLIYLNFRNLNTNSFFKFFFSVFIEFTKKCFFLPQRLRLMLYT